MATESPPRIFHLTLVRTRIPGKPRARRTENHWLKVPYASLFGLVDTLARAMATKQIAWFKLEAARPRDIGAHRDELKRWDEALGTTAEVKWP